ncbi:hypothetical protein ACLBXM_04690 [Xanthobacteraceae bacterium A53D]
MLNEKDPTAGQPALRVRPRRLTIRDRIALIGLALVVVGVLIATQLNTIDRSLFVEEEARCTRRFAAKHTYFWSKEMGCMVVLHDGKWVHESQMPD